jgi:NhaP-type Na+/H+ or K+/H+ antiporter
VADEKLDSGVSVSIKFVFFLIALSIFVSFSVSFFSRGLLDFLGPAYGGVVVGFIFLGLGLYLERLKKKKNNNFDYKNNESQTPD